MVHRAKEKVAIVNDWQIAITQIPISIAQTGVPATTTHVLATPPVKSEGGGEKKTSEWTFFGLSLFAFAIIALLAVISTRRMRLVPRGLQNFVEWVFEALYSIPESGMGPRGRQYGPLIATFFLYIIVMNFTGLIPGLKSGTASLSITLGLSLVAFSSVQYFGFKTHGIRYLLHFLGPVPALAILIAPLEIIAEVVRIASLSIRLFGNISGEEQVISALSNQLSPIAAVLMLPLQVLTILLQAFVFSLLLTVYISLATEKHEDHHSGAEEAHAV